jgi:hypothetical protein
MFLDLFERTSPGTAANLKQRWKDLCSDPRCGPRCQAQWGETQSKTIVDRPGEPPLSTLILTDDSWVLHEGYRPGMLGTFCEAHAEWLEADVMPLLAQAMSMVDGAMNLSGGER